MTKIIEAQVFEYLFLKRGCQVGLEVDLPLQMCPKDGQFTHRVDIAAIKGDEITCVEIKVSLADFKSPNGHNLCGHKNYYAVPNELISQIELLVPKHIGIISCNVGRNEYIKMYQRTPVVYRKAKRRELNLISRSDWVDSEYYDTSHEHIKKLFVQAMEIARNSTIRRLLWKQINNEKGDK
jgi:hypothetical protein